MDIDFTLRFSIDDPSMGRRRRFVKVQSMSTPQVPRIGETVVVLATSREHLGAHRVTDVIYAPNGSVILEFNLEGLQLDAASQIDVLKSSGFREVSE